MKEELKKLLDIISSQSFTTIKTRRDKNWHEGQYALKFYCNVSGEFVYESFLTVGNSDTYEYYTSLIEEINNEFMLEDENAIIPMAESVFKTHFPLLCTSNIKQNKKLLLV